MEVKWTIIQRGFLLCPAILMFFFTLFFFLIFFQNVNTYFYDHVPENDHESLFAILPSEIPIGTINLPVELLQDPDL